VRASLTREYDKDAKSAIKWSFARAVISRASKRLASESESKNKVTLVSSIATDNKERRVKAAYNGNGLQRAAIS
jgi:hypothetical protein